MAEDFKEKNDFLKSVLSTGIEQIKIVDTRAMAVFGAVGVITGAFLTKVAKIDWNMPHSPYALPMISISLLFIILAFKYTIHVIYPRTISGDKKGLIYFQDIALQTKEEYLANLKSANSEELFKNYAMRAYMLAVNNRKKFRALRVGIIHMLITLVLLIVTFLII